MDYQQLCAAAAARLIPEDPDKPVQAPAGQTDTGAPGGPVAGTPKTDVLPLERRVALRNWGRIDPHSLEDYVTHAGGYSGLDAALELGREGTIVALRRSGLRGRGGAGYPTAEKWQACHDAGGQERYVICNAIDGDPQSRTAKTLVGGDPHAVLEGILIGAYAVGAAQCYVCLNSEYAEEIALLREALDQMRRYGVLGEDILGSGFSCDIAVREVASSLVAGEETALIRALEGRQPLPYLRFDHPAVKGLHDMPTLVNSAETLADVSAVFQELSADGREEGRPLGDALGAQHSPGTKVVTVCGDVSCVRTVEVPFGTTLRALLQAAQGPSGPQSGAVGRPDLKTVQFGGPTGAFFAGDSLDTPIDYEALEQAGSILGSATLQVFGRGHARCSVEIARDAMSYLAEQSCGKCVVCREGTYQLADMLTDMAEGRGRADDRELMLELCGAMKAGSICGLGKTAADPLLSLMRLFPDDFAVHLDQGCCPGVKGASERGAEG